MIDVEHLPFPFTRRSDEEICARATALYTSLAQRRSCRSFSSDPIPLDAVRTAIRTAGTAPSGAHKQPWTFCLITDPEIKRKIRAAAEEEEKETYAHRMSDEWREALAPIGTTWEKPFLELAPALIVVFRHDYELRADGGRRKNYYVQESVGLAVGMLIASLADAGIVTLTHTPSPMHFLSEILGRPKNERPYLLLPLGYPDAEATVPDFPRKPLDEILVEY